MKNISALFLFLCLFSCQSNTPDSTPPTTHLDPKEEQANTSTEPVEIETIPETNIVPMSTPDTAYVIAKSGLRVRKAPSLEGERLGVRPYGKKVLMTHKTGIPLSIQDEGKTINGEWMGIETRVVSTGKMEKVTGYIFSGFLSKEKPKDSAVDITKLFANSRLERLGIGGIIIDLHKLPSRSAENVIAANDTLRLYKKDLQTVGSYASHQFLRNGNRRYLNRDFKNCPNDRNERLLFSSDLGLGDFPYVMEVKNGFAYLGKLCGEAIWIKLEELNPTFATFKSHLDIFKSNPNGGGWEHGYTYVGNNKVLRTAPELDAKAIVNNILPDYEVHLLGPVKNNWAKVKVKKAKHVFGEMYYEKSIYGKTWEGWIMIVEPDGTPLIEPHIFGC